MKKKTLLTLGVCALAMGAVAGAVSARAATEARAGDPEYYVAGSFNSWKKSAEYKMALSDEKKDGKDQYYLSLKGLVAGQEFKCTDFTNDGWHPANNMSIPSNGDYTIFYVPEGGVSDWTAGGGYVYLNLDEEGGDVQVDYYAVGTFNAWAEKDANYKMTLSEDKKDGKDQYQIDLLGLKTTDKLKAMSSVGTWYPGGSGNDYEVPVAGDYTLYFVPEGGVAEWTAGSGYLYLALHETPASSETSAASSEAVSEETSEATSVAPTFADGWYLVGDMNGWKQDVAYYTDGYEEDKNVAMWLEVTLEKDATFAFAYSNADELDWNQAKRYADIGATGGAKDNFVDDEGTYHNFKCTTAGTYDIYMGEDYKLYFEAHGGSSSSETSETSETSAAPTFADGWYMVGSMNEWKQNAAYYTDGYEEEKNVAMWLEVTLAKDDTFAFAYSNADKLDWDQAKRFADRGTTGGAREVFVDAEDGDHNFKCTVAGTYDIYMGLDYKLYFEAHGGETSSDSSAATSEATSETPVLGGYVYISTAHGATSTTLYTWEGEGGEGHQNAPWPGVEINTVEGVAVTFGTNFNGQGGLWRVPVTSLMEKFIITIQASENEVNKEYKTGDLVAAAGVYVAPGAEATDAAIGAQAELCFDIEAAIGATTNHSVCEIGKEQAAALVARYDALEKTEVLDEATYWTYDVEYKDLTPETKPAKNFTYAELLVELRSTAESTNHSVWNVTSVANNTMLVITLLVVGGGLVGAVALYFISKKRRLQK